MTERPRPPKTREFVHEGQARIGDYVEVLGKSEPACSYSLEDGTVFSAAVLVIDVYRLREVVSAQGDPVYKFQFRILTNVWTARQRNLAVEDDEMQES